MYSHIYSSQLHRRCHPMLMTSSHVSEVTWSLLVIWSRSGMWEKQNISDIYIYNSSIISSNQRLFALYNTARVLEKIIWQPRACEGSRWYIPSTRAVLYDFDKFHLRHTVMFTQISTLVHYVRPIHVNDTRLFLCATNRIDKISLKRI